MGRRGRDYPARPCASPFRLACARANSLLANLSNQGSNQVLTIPNKKKSPILGAFLFMAEREGFEPPDPFESMVFKTTAFDHSATSPVLFVYDAIVSFVYLPGLKRRFPPRYSGLPALRPLGRTSRVLICSRQISRPLSHVSGSQWQVSSSTWLR